MKKRMKKLGVKFDGHCPVCGKPMKITQLYYSVNTDKYSFTFKCPSKCDFQTEWKD